MRGLPDLKLIEAFEAAARHASFTRAAGELNVLQPAVSRKIARLEEELGAKLFHRTKPDLTLTEEGEALYTTVSMGMDQIRQTSNAIRSRRQTDTLTVNTSIGFASCYLMPRLADFGRKHPDIELELITRDQNRSFDPVQSDIVVLFGEDGLPGGESRLVFPEELIAVTGPNHPAAGRLLTPDQLVGERLLHLSDHYHAGDWGVYMSGTGVTVPESQRSARFTSFMVYLQAALNGEGIALGWRRLVDDLIANERLCIVSEHSHPSSRGYHCCLTASGTGKPAAMSFLAWLCGEET